MSRKGPFFLIRRDPGPSPAARAAPTSVAPLWRMNDEAGCLPVGSSRGGWADLSRPKQKRAGGGGTGELRTRLAGVPGGSTNSPMDNEPRGYHPTDFEPPSGFYTARKAVDRPSPILLDFGYRRTWVLRQNQKTPKAPPRACPFQKWVCGPWPHAPPHRQTAARALHPHSAPTRSHFSYVDISRIPNDAKSRSPPS